jgi:hypothetical protein
MKFEEVLPLMRDGKIGIDPFGSEWKMNNPDLLSYRCKNGAWMPCIYLGVGGEWTIKESPKKVRVWDWAFYDDSKDPTTYNVTFKCGWSEEQVKGFISKLRMNGDGSWRLQRKIEGTEREVEVS